MKKSAVSAAVLLAFAFLAACSSSNAASGTDPASGGGAASQASSAPPADRPKTTNAVLEIGPMLTGTFQGTTPGNNLTAVIIGNSSPNVGSIYNLSMRVTGSYRDGGVREQGVIRLENQGRTVSLQYIPHFDPAAGTLTTDALRFTPRELESACNFDVKARGDGYFGETVGTTTCARAIHGAIGKWSFEVEPGSIRIRNSESGETLRFKRTSS
jgi:hypothetical protein